MSSFNPNLASAADSGLFGLPDAEEEAYFVLLPVPFDATTSYMRGTAEGPKAILKASRQVDLYDLETGTPYEAGIHLCEVPKEVEEWNQQARRAADPVLSCGGQIGTDPGLLEQVQAVNTLSKKRTDWVFEKTLQYLRQHKLVGVIGGDHSVSLGALQACAEVHGTFGILHIDAHADLRQAYEGFEESHASIMYNAMTKIPRLKRIVQVGIRDLCEEEMQRIEDNEERIALYDMPSLNDRLFLGDTWDELCQDIVSDLPDDVYISFDIDALDPALCPHTGTPVPGGLSFSQATYLIKTVVQSGKRIIGFDLTEVAPGLDSKDEWDGNVAARLLYKLIGFSWQSQTDAT